MVSYVQIEMLRGPTYIRPIILADRIMLLLVSALRTAAMAYSDELRLNRVLRSLKATFERYDDEASRHRARVSRRSALAPRRSWSTTQDI